MPRHKCNNGMTFTWLLSIHMNICRLDSSSQNGVTISLVTK